MGHYLKKDSKGVALPDRYIDKILALVEDGAKTINRPMLFEKNLIVVADNGSYSVAAYCYDEAEFRRMSLSDSRPTMWLRYPYAEHLKKENTND